jgi:hypothetical protein
MTEDLTVAHPDPASTSAAPTAPPEPPVYQLPERAELDPVSVAALALMDVVPPMLEQGTDGSAVAVDLKAIATTVLDAVAGLPRVPQWVEARTMGGASRGGGLPDPSVTVDLDPTDPAVVRCLVEVTATERGEIRSIAQSAAVPVADARQWFLAGLAACAVAEDAASEPSAGNDGP